MLMFLMLMMIIISVDVVVDVNVDVDDNDNNDCYLSIAPILSKNTTSTTITTTLPHWMIINFLNQFALANRF